MTDIPQQRSHPESEPVCTVCIANFNGLKVIDDCLQSVLAQDCAFHVEIIVHDDASTDGSADYIAANYPQVTLIRSEWNVGYCVSNNRMARQARGQYLLLLNNDASLFPDALQTLQATARMNSEPTILTLPQYEAATGRLVDRGLRLDPFLNATPNHDRSRLEVSTVHGACLWIPTALWNALGGFPEWFHMLAEDLYLCCAARVRGTKIMVAAGSGYRHHIGYSLGGGKAQGNRLVTTTRRRALSERNKTFVMVICYPGASMWILFSLHLLLLLIEGLVLSVMRPKQRVLQDIYLSVFRSVWEQRSRLRHYRTTIKSSRRISAFRFFSSFTPFPQKLLLLLRHGFPKIR